MILKLTMLQTLVLANETRLKTFYSELAKVILLRTAIWLFGMFYLNRKRDFSRGIKIEADEKIRIYSNNIQHFIEHENGC